VGYRLRYTVYNPFISRFWQILQVFHVPDSFHMGNLFQSQCIVIQEVHCALCKFPHKLIWAMDWVHKSFISCFWQILKVFNVSDSFRMGNLFQNWCIVIQEVHCALYKFPHKVIWAMDWDIQCTSHLFHFLTAFCRYSADIIILRLFKVIIISFWLYCECSWHFILQEQAI
jgi:hypothetical protein